ncbi:MAG: ATP-binding protein [Eubacteriales bacterium]|nr:ATP-binding protein [Eubacteriales bacterium]
MIIAVLSGKGGTGKTTVAVSLASVITNSQYIDCDVEEPNGFIFMKPLIERTDVVVVKVPDIDPSRCTLCGDCARICQFHALAATKSGILTFPDLCHHCGACTLVCRADAIREVPRRIGVIEADAQDRMIQGKLDVGQPVGIPIITALKKRIQPQATSIVDCSPGSSCAVVRSLEGSDYALLVTEPTPFGLHDLKITVELVRKMQIPAGVVLNKAGADNSLIEAYCQNVQLPILMQIPFSRTLAEAYSNGRLPIHSGSRWITRFEELFQNILESFTGTPL